MYKEHLHYLSGLYFHVSCPQTKDDLKDIINRNEKERNIKTGRVPEKGKNVNIELNTEI